MGYTHYWTFEPNKIKDTEVLRKKFEQASKTIEEAAKFINVNKSYKICGGLGEGKPILNETEIWFNGERAKDLDHETFKIHWSDPNILGDYRGFCKTARKPYDLLVCFTLLVFADTFPEDVFSFSSDGEFSNQEWQRAIEFYTDFTGKAPKLP
jgi:hypothetical protein